MIILLSVDDEDDNDKENGWKDYLNVDGNDMILWKSSESIWYYLSCAIWIFKCDKCIKSFSQQCSFKMHLHTHSLEKPHGC